MTDLPFASLSCSSRNLGDDIQVLAGLQYLPPDPLFIDRDHLSRFDREPHRLILNGWFTHYPDLWPPAPPIRPLITSIHLAADDLYGARNIAWLREHSDVRPIGVRDVGTAELLLRHGINAFFSGCLTLTFAASGAAKRTDEVCVVDMPKEAVAIVRGRVRSVTTPSHHLPRVRQRFIAFTSRLRAAASLLNRYRRSRLVVTLRLHAALPALALGTPVLFVTDDPGNRRFSGLIDHLHTVRLADFLSGRFNYDLSDPPPNKVTFRPIADELSRSVADFTGRPPRPFDQALEEVLRAGFRRDK